MKTETKYQIGDKVVLVDYEKYCKCVNTSPTNERLQSHYNYMKSKEPLEIYWIWYPGELTYEDNGEDETPAYLRGLPTKEPYYNIHTPRSKMYLFREEMLLPYVEESSEEPDAES